MSLWGTAYAPATNQDSSGYICGAQNLIEHGALLVCGTNHPLVWLAPFYSLLLAALDAVGIRRLEGARTICALSFGINTLLMGGVLFASTSSLALSMFGEILFMTMGDLVIAHLFAMSEAPFLVFLLLFIWWAWRALEDDRMRWVFLAGLAAATASLTRYMGASLIVSGAIALAWNDKPPLRIRLKRAALFVTVATAPLAGWFCRNFYEVHSLTERQLGFYPLDWSQYTNAALTVVRWFLPLSPDYCTAIGGAVIVAVLAALGLVIYWKPGKLEWLLALVALSNALIILASRLFFDPYVVFAGRMLVPILVCVLILILTLAHSILTRPGVDWFWQAIAVSVAVVCVLGNTVRAAVILDKARIEGFEGSSRYFRDSTLIGWLARLPPNALIYSNEPEAIYFFSGRMAELLPLLTDPRSKKPRDNLSGEVDQMHDRLGEHAATIVYFSRWDNDRLHSMPTPSEMPAVYHLSMRPVLQNGEGVIYEVRAEAYSPPHAESRAQNHQ